jgi:adenylosuccinate synthase
VAPAHASKCLRRGLRLDHLYNYSDDTREPLYNHSNRQEMKNRLRQDIAEYWGALKSLGITERELTAQAQADPSTPSHVIGFLLAEDKEDYTITLLEKWVVNNPLFPERADVSAELQRVVGTTGGTVLLEGPQSYWLSSDTEKFWTGGTAARTDAAGILSSSRLPVPKGPHQPSAALVLNVHKFPGSSRVGDGANPCAYVPQQYFDKVGAMEEDLRMMRLDWSEVSRRYHESVQRTNGVVRPLKYEAKSGIVVG